MILENKNAVITGCNRGIGRAILECFAINGANIWACMRTITDELITTCNELSAKYNVDIKLVELDLSSEDSVKDAAKKIIGDKKPIDILVNNAGMVPESKLFQMSSINYMKEIFEVNFFSQMLFTQYIIRVMTRQKKGSIVNMASIAALDGGPAQIEYVSSKAAIVGATKKLAAELGIYNIRVNAIAPGMTNTDMVKNMREDLYENTLNNVIMKRLAEPVEIANAVMFLASDLSSFITSQVIRVDGGIMR